MIFDWKSESSQPKPDTSIPKTPEVVTKNPNKSKLKEEKKVNPITIDYNTSLLYLNVRFEKYI